MLKTLLVVGLVLAAVTFYWSISAAEGYVWRSYQKMYPAPAMKTILLWTTWWGTPGDPELAVNMLLSWGISQFHNWTAQTHIDLRDFGCDQESYKCTITSNRSYLKEESLYDAILFHQYHMSLYDIPDRNKRRVHQNYVFHTLENPHLTRTSPTNTSAVPDNFFNVTMTYHRKSMIHTPYGRVVKIGNHPMGEKLDLYIEEYGKQNAR